MLFDHFAEFSLLFIRKGVDSTEHERADEVRIIVLVEHLFEVGENNPFGFVQFDSDQFCALAVEVVETVVIDDFGHIG